MKKFLILLVSLQFAIHSLCNDVYVPPYDANYTNTTYFINESIHEYSGVYEDRCSLLCTFSKDLACSYKYDEFSKKFQEVKKEFKEILRYLEEEGVPNLYVDGTNEAQNRFSQN